MGVGALPRRLFQYLACSLVALLVLLLYYSRQLEGQPAVVPGPTASAAGPPALQPQQAVCQHQPVYPADIEVRVDIGNMSSSLLFGELSYNKTLWQISC
jgi:hypothetical protein